jgi:putative glycosyltransferase (TIGR04348 family)
MRSTSTASTVLIVTPFLAAANNGNWRTAARWSERLSPHYRVIVQAADAPLPDAADVLIALHARRSHAIVARWRAQARGPLIVTLTGTDLYRDVPRQDADALASLDAADRLIVLQDDALGALASRHRAKADVVYQSAPSLPRWPAKSGARLSCVFVGHLRLEKDPVTVLRAWKELSREAPIAVAIIGEGLDDALTREVRDAAAADLRIRWLGALSHARTRQAIRRAHVLICSSQMEGGANVVVEAVTAGTAVLASRISGNVGMLGSDYRGFFEPGSAEDLSRLLERCLAERTFVEALEHQGAARAPLFTPDAERRALRAVVERALAARSPVLPDSTRGKIA